MRPSLTLLSLALALFALGHSAQAANLSQKKQVHAKQALSCAGQDADCAYFYALRKGDRPFRYALDQLIESSGNPDTKLVLSGPSTPMRVRQIGEQRYLLGTSCEKHNCGANRLIVAYQPSTRRIVGSYLYEGTQQWLGQPSNEEQALLRTEE